MFGGYATRSSSSSIVVTEGDHAEFQNTIGSHPTSCEELIPGVKVVGVDPYGSILVGA